MAFLSRLVVLPNRSAGARLICREMKMQMKGAEVRVAESKSALSTELAEYVIEKASAAKAARGKFVCAVSGGSLPNTLAADLILDKNKDKAEFPSWHVYFADERCVPLDHEDSNYLLAKNELFDKSSIPSDQIYPIDPSLDPERCAAAYAETIKKNMGEGTPVFDVLFLGIGPDGHTCSLFPDHQLLKENSKTVAHILDSPKPPPERVTLTFPVLNAAHDVVFVTTGSGKKDALKSILKDPESKLPASMVKPTDGSVVWFVDKEAANTLS
eukprot:Plantae.Rhodophyta-Purpureofilum_apyrenoidigerum.ctg6493.p1 GENE.Plantae.Rhodophyta-Purpureofilum_apyrenoidigerum.ctg6493~~Plantae.Rhodophyta-Purpureofilum_apyrenoidigerum.ctg6493.p1  ORF type:complete len:270 (+),score=46.87 Plantae.Rhodophyta-Purpureofilum_apyrenoidigerum.ctg6493:251-1060(+)